MNQLNSIRAEFYKALAHPTRIKILELLKNGEKCVCNIIEELGLEQSNVSQHLNVLKNQGIVASRREGTFVMYYVLNPRIYDLIDITDKILEMQLETVQKELRERRNKI
ncbi:transcriptional regulator, ArsR family [Caldanaerobius fijiensis DSM 17918]|uniref:Transcriptional regulator, ArsR family n=1 Tax=Caldanaerobius fijiensis DSM 17918 TaxID=1121256 RepID=A0A1M5FIN5_9THEO|nr:metalloregulator ArsR/SmtB family transcription factor [Caldanaerobius fijiensis]SHF91356.1 transcriptional regulator, ArsR family [Caldanaerobius fijiensis DSM 17918]